MIAVFPASKIENEPYWCAGNVPEWQIQNVLEISLIVDHFWKKSGKLWENVKYIQKKVQGRPTAAPGTAAFPNKRCTVTVLMSQKELRF